MEEDGRLKDVNKNSFADGQREGDGKCKYKRLVCWDLLASCTSALCCKIS